VSSPLAGNRATTTAANYLAFVQLASIRLHAVTTLMMASRSWDDFKRMINVALPKKGKNLEFNFGPQ